MGSILNSLINSAVNSAKHAISSEINSEIRNGVHAAAQQIRQEVGQTTQDIKKDAPLESFDRDQDLQRRMQEKGVTDESVQELQEQFKELFGDNPDTISEDSKFAQMSQADQIRAMQKFASLAGSMNYKAFGALMGNSAELYHQAGDNETAAKYKIREKQSDEVVTMMDEWGKTSENREEDT